MRFVVYQDSSEFRFIRRILVNDEFEHISTTQRWHNADARRPPINDCRLPVLELV